MGENVPLWSYGESSESGPSSSNIKVSTSNLSEHLGASSTIESNPSNNSSNNSFRNDYMDATFSLDQNIGGGLLEDIIQVLSSEVPLHATETLHHWEASTSKNEECFMQEKRGIASHDYVNIVAQRSQIDEGVEAMEDIQPSEPEPTLTLRPSDENLDHIPTIRRNRSEQKRRQLINAKLRTIQALLPASHDKKDHASILDDAINYIKFLKFQVEMLSTRLIRQNELYASYNPRMMMGGTGLPHWPLQFPMVGPSNYSLNMVQSNFQVRPIFQYPVAPLFAPRPISPVLLPPQPSAPIRLQPPIPYTRLSTTSAGLAPSSSTTEQFNCLFSETNRH